MIVVGIDPGKSGCLWAVDASTRNTVSFHDIDCLGNDIDVIAIRDWLSQFPLENTLVATENPHPQGRANEGCKTVYSAFQYGKSVGTIIGLISGLGYKLVRVSPATWKTHFNITAPKKTYNERKKIAVEKAVTLSPADANYFTYTRFDRRVMKHDRAEAFLVAIYCIEKCLIPSA